MRILWRWKLLFLAFAVLIPLGAYLLERSKPKVYQSSALLDAGGSSLAAGSPDLAAVSDNPLAVARLVTTDAVVNLAIHQLKEPPSDASSLLGEVSATADTSTGFLTITVQNANPARAAAIANAFAGSLHRAQAARANQSIRAQVGLLEAQLAGTRSSDQVARGGLTQQIAQLKALGRSSAIGAEVIDPALPSATPVGPKTARAVELALVIALLLGAGAVLVAENSDRRLRTPEDLERLTEKPLLGTIPRGAFSPDKYLRPRNIEAFRTLRAALTYYNMDRPVASAVIVSPGPEEGKTTVAIGLALATALAGSRAVLIDADLRRPQVSARLGIPAGDGLAAVLAHERELDEVLIEHPIDAPDGGRLLVLPAGPPPANPSALIGSQEMRALLRELEDQADLVIVDTAATLAVSDSLPLIQAVSGIIMIVRLDRSAGTAVRRLQHVIASSHGRVMGAVATGTGSAPYGYSDNYYDAKNGSSGTSRGVLGGRRRRAAVQGPIGPSSGAPRPDSALTPESSPPPSSPATPPTPRPAPRPESAPAPTPVPISGPDPLRAGTSAVAFQPWTEAKAGAPPGPKRAEHSWRQRLTAARKTMANRAGRPER